MAVQNRIVKVQKRNRALVKFDDTADPAGHSPRGGIHRRLSPGLRRRRQRGHLQRPRHRRQDRRVSGRRRGGVPQFRSAPSDLEFPAHHRGHPGRGAARAAQLRFPEHRRRLRMLSLGPALAAGGRHYARQVRGQRFPAQRRWNRRWPGTGSAAATPSPA